MSSLDEIRTERLKKLSLLSERGIDAYPSSSSRTHTIQQAAASFETLEKEHAVLTLVGRVLARRGQGNILFANFKDGTGTFQAVIKADVAGEEALQLFEAVVDAGDFLSFTGSLFTTKRGEQSLLVSSWRMLTKSLLPLPDKWHGLKDEDERLRKRYLDLLLNDELRELFVRKERFWRVTRQFFVERGFCEVETPMLERTTGGAEARPFQTHHHDFDIDVYLRISVGELWQKRLMAAGFEKTFEIGKVFRNEGTSPEHLQEFTNLEFYQAYADYHDGMKLITDMYRTIARQVYGTTSFTYKNMTFDLDDKWREIDYVEEVERQTGVNVLDASEAQLRDALAARNVPYEGENKERMTDALWKYCRKQIAGPAFLLHHPTLIAPLAKSSTERPHTTQMFQPLIAGSEVGRGYSELNDPIDQRERFELQKSLRAAGDEEAMMHDEEFVEMLEHGMPPTLGFGFGERLFAIFENRPIRETQLFPLVRPRTSRAKEAV